MTDTRASLRARLDACIAHFAIAMFVCFGSAAAWDVPGDGALAIARMAATVTFVASLGYGVVAWLYAASAYWRAKKMRNDAGA